jgi:hypothetical protein
MKRIVFCVAVAVAALAVVAPRENGAHERGAPDLAWSAASVGAHGAGGICRCAPVEPAGAALVDAARLTQPLRVKASARGVLLAVAAVLVILRLGVPAAARRCGRLRRRTGAAVEWRGRAWSRGPPPAIAG